MDWWLILLIFIVIVLIVWWLLSRQVDGEGEVVHHEEAAEPVAKDDLTKIEGIGPKVQGLFNAAGISTFAALAEKSTEALEGILDPAGAIYKAMDPSSWPKQAKLAAKGKWEELQKLQDELIGGK